ncbi:MAG: CinA family protein [Erysipelotrichales bacterium]|nr:MAG: CinA family protein [Erysipelotrichales bacterium]
MEALVDLLRKKQWTICTCESFTGGLFAVTFTNIPGASDVFKGSIVAYVNESKTKLAGVSEKTLQDYGAISAETVEAMAKNTRIRFGCDICVAFSGNAGPRVLEGKQVGETYMCIALQDQVRVYHDQFHGDRSAVRFNAVDAAVLRIKEMIRDFGR